MSFFFVLPSKIPFRITKSPETKNFITRLWIHSISSIAKAAFLWGFNYFFFFLSPKKPKKLRRKIFLPDLRNGERPSCLSLLFRGNRMFFRWIYQIFSLKYYLDHYNNSIFVIMAFLHFSTLFFMIRASTMDPGIIPKNVQTFHKRESVKKNRTYPMPTEKTSKIISLSGTEWLDKTSRKNFIRI